MTTPPGLPRTGPGEDRCSAKGCREVGVWEVRWQNPSIHTGDRRKVWLACEEHRRPLSDFLSVRGFLREVVPHPPA